ncbi:hypothetical protein BCVP_CDS0210 [Bacillus phage BC-VP]|nr:hypothetical protein BCVP_CDS0210 [Bacillus phage BC-VP]
MRSYIVVLVLCLTTGYLKNTCIFRLSYYIVDTLMGRVTI